MFSKLTKLNKLTTSSHIVKQNFMLKQSLKFFMNRPITKFNILQSYILFKPNTIIKRNYSPIPVPNENTKTQEQSLYDRITDDEVINKYPWSFRLIAGSTGMSGYACLAQINENITTDNHIVSAIAIIGILYSFGHLIGLTATNFKDFIKQSLIAFAAIIGLILFTYLCDLFFPIKGRDAFTIKIGKNYDDQN